VLDVDLSTLQRGLASRPKDDLGAKPAGRELGLRLHETKEDIPNDALTIAATAPLSPVVDEILRAMASGPPASRW